jgi:mannose-1-phosphate guanylyltransferase/mannose-6-phosphate isomerase
MALAAIAAAQIAGPDAILALLPADHWVADAAAFRRAMVAACAHADEGAIVTLGVRPTAPETGYGYIEAGGELGDGVREVARFVEKPKLDRALEFLQSGKHFWNAGVFVLRADRAWRAIVRHQPETASHLAVLRDHAVGSAGWNTSLAEAFPQCPSISVDFGVMEHETGLRVVPLDAGWSDVGTWSSLLPLKRDGEANFVRGEVIAVDAEGCVLVSDGPLLAVVGVSDVAVVATKDATLVLPLDRSQDVREVVQALVADGRDKLL